jgi:hypothetical protein
MYSSCPYFQESLKYLDFPVCSFIKICQLRALTMPVWVLGVKSDWLTEFWSIYVQFLALRLIVAVPVIVGCPGSGITTWRKILHAFLDWQAESDVWFQWASSCTGFIVGSKLRAAAEEAAPAIARETYGDTSAQIPAYWMCGGFWWWPREPAWCSQIPEPPPTSSAPPSTTQLFPTCWCMQVRISCLAYSGTLKGCILLCET